MGRASYLAAMRAAALALPLLLGSIALAGCLGPGPIDPASLVPGLPIVDRLLPQAPGFGPEVIVDAELGGSEPSLVVDPEGRIFIAAPTGLSPVGGAQDPSSHRYSGQFWRSLDDGQTFEHLEGLGVLGLYGPSIGGGDSDIAADAQGNLYAIDLWLGNTGLLTSQDHGDSWLRGSPVTFLTPGNDRQWIDVNQATGEVFITVNSFSTGLWVIRSRDAGLTFPQQTLAVPHADRGGCICPPGVMAVDEATGNVYLPYYLNPKGVGLAVSKDGGASFENLVLPETDSAHLPGDDEAGGAFTVITHDTRGNLYLVWESVTERGRRIALQTSVDQGASWTPPVFVHDIPAGLQIFPWVVAGEPGRVAIAWYEASPGEDKDRWDVRLAFSATGLDGAPAFALATLNAEPVLRGSYDRSLLGDFFELAVGLDGSIHAVWNARLQDADTLVYARQVDGPRLLSGAPAPEAAPERPLTLPAIPAVKPAPPGELAEEVAAEAGDLVPPR